METKSRYVALKPDSNGIIHYTSENHETWKILYERQVKLIKERACPEFLEGIEKLELNERQIPQCAEVSKSLGLLTGWSVKPVEALISFEEFFELLSKKQFPAASFIRRREDLDYLQEPDIFHELFGHCPMLTNDAFASFTHEVGKLGLSLNKEERVALARLYWFTVEFGLIQTKKGLRIYGGGILSSKEESVYALESEKPKRHTFDLLQILRTPYRYDELQKNYFIIESFEQIFSLLKTDLRPVFDEAKKMGMLDMIFQDEMDVRSC